MTSMERSIEIDVAVDSVYEQWMRFDQFPMFMEGVHDVRPLDRRTLRWRGEAGGQIREWCAEITEQTPGRRLAWRRRGDRCHVVTVTLNRLGPTRTRVVLRVELDSADGEPAATTAARIEGDLRRLKSLLQARDAPARPSRA